MRTEKEHSRPEPCDFFCVALFPDRAATVRDRPRRPIRVGPVAGIAIQFDPSPP
jgi:hypothetical protein